MNTTREPVVPDDPGTLVGAPGPKAGTDRTFDGGVESRQPERGTCQDVAPAIPSAWPSDPLARPARGVARATPRGLRRAGALRALEDVGTPPRCCRKNRDAAFAEAAHVTRSDGSLAPFIERFRQHAHCESALSMTPCPAHPEHARTPLIVDPEMRRASTSSRRSRMPTCPRAQRRGDRERGLGARARRADRRAGDR